MMTADPAALFAHNEPWGDMSRWESDALELHQRGGIFRVETTKFRPFWAVIDHAAVQEIERQPAMFTNQPEPVLTATEQLEQRTVRMETLIHVDDPLHGKLRNLTVDWFKPRTLRTMIERLDELSDEALDLMRRSNGRCDFATEIALPYPLQVILRILGLPEEDYPRMLTLTQQLFGQEDPDMRRSKMSAQVQAEVLQDFYGYFDQLTNDRRARPTDDLATVIANSEIDGEPLEGLARLGYYLIMATAGHDTTSSAIAGGMELLARSPDQLRLLQADPAKIPNAVDEMIRLTSPVRHFMRTAQEDTEILGQPIAAGDWLYLSFKAANLDPKVFEDPRRFDVERDNAHRHVAFGHGAHYCLGAQLAKMELRSLFSRLIPEIRELELDGEPRTTKTTLVGGHKNLPIRYSLRQAT